MVMETAHASAHVYVRVCVGVVVVISGVRSDAVYYTGREVPLGRGFSLVRPHRSEAAHARARPLAVALSATVLLLLLLCVSWVGLVRF